MMIGTIIILVLALDQMTKFLIRANFIVGETLPMIPDILHLTYVRNTGAAFSMFRNMPVVTVGFPILMVILCLAASVYFYRRKERIPAALCALISAGGMGNLIDRLMLGYVTDMIDFRVFPVFNVADIAICLGVFLAGLALLWQGREDDGGK